MSFPPFTSVTRWLLVVIGCAVLATAQPMRAAEGDAAAPRRADTIIYPKGAPDTPGGVAGREKDTSHSYVLVVALILAAAGVWVLVQRRRGAPLAPRGSRKLQIEETRALGNRQYLVVATYEDRKFLLGVTAGQIQLVSDLGAKPGPKSGEPLT